MPTKYTQTENLTIDGIPTYDAAYKVIQLADSHETINTLHIVCGFDDDLWDALQYAAVSTLIVGELVLYECRILQGIPGDGTQITAILLLEEMTESNRLDSEDEADE